MILKNRKYYITSVKPNNPYKNQSIELFRKQGDKLIRVLNNDLELLVGKLEFTNGKRLIIKEMDGLLQYSIDWKDHTFKT